MDTQIESDGTAEVAQGHARVAMESLARELKIPLEQVERIYARESAAIEAEARIKNFVPVLVTSRVRRVLRRQRKPARA